MLQDCRWSNGNAADACIVVGGSNPGLLTFAAAGLLQIISAPGFEPPTCELAAVCITTRPPPVLSNVNGPDCYIKCLLLTKHPKCVFLSA